MICVVSSHISSSPRLGHVLLLELAAFQHDASLLQRLEKEESSAARGPASPTFGVTKTAGSSGISSSAPHGLEQYIIYYIYISINAHYILRWWYIRMHFV